MQHLKVAPTNRYKSERPNTHFMLRISTNITGAMNLAKAQKVPWNNCFN